MKEESVETRHWAHIGESTFIGGIWLLFTVHRLLGRWPFRFCLYPVVAIYWATRPDVRAASMEYFSRLQSTTGALGHQPDWRDSFRHLLRFAETMLDKLLAASGRYPFERVRTEGREEFYAEIQPGQGGVIMTAHMGCLELCSAMAHHKNRVRLNILVHTRHAEKFNRLLKRLNPDNQFRLMEVNEVGPATAILLSEKVAAGEFIVIAGDRVPVSASQTVSINFLGKPAPFPIGPYVLAALLKCRLYLMGCIYEEGGYTVSFEKLAERVDLPRGQRQQAIAVVATHYAGRLTALLCRAPYDWFNFFPFWDQTNVQTKSES